MREKSRKILLAKVISWRAVSILLTLVVMFCITGEIKSSTGITLALHAVLTVGHFIFENMWEKYEAR